MTGNVSSMMEKLSSIHVERAKLRGDMGGMTALVQRTKVVVEIRCPTCPWKFSIGTRRWSRTSSFTFKRTSSIDKIDGNSLSSRVCLPSSMCWRGFFTTVLGCPEAPREGLIPFQKSRGKKRKTWLAVVEKVLPVMRIGPRNRVKRKVRTV